jgi:hypothetical protein
LICGFRGFYVIDDYCAGSCAIFGSGGSCAIFGFVGFCAIAGCVGSCATGFQALLAAP